MQTATVLSCLVAARTLLQEAQRHKAELIGVELQPLLAALQPEIQTVEEMLQHEQYVQLAQLLPNGFTYAAD